MLLPCAHNVRLSPVHVPNLHPPPTKNHDELEAHGLTTGSRIFFNVHLLAHLAIGVPGHLIEVNVGLEIMPNSCPTVIAFLVFFH